MKEAEVWEKIEKEKAKERQSGGQGGILLTDHGQEANKGEVNDIIAEKVNLGSGRTYERAKPAVEDEIKRIKPFRLTLKVGSLDNYILN